jgi:hypothetical protein
MTLFTDQDIDYSFVREFSSGGDTFGPSSSRDYRRERMRIAILREGKEGRAFHDSGMTYAEAYRRCYGTPLDLRRAPRAPDAPIYSNADEDGDDLTEMRLFKDDP